MNFNKILLFLFVTNNIFSNTPIRTGLLGDGVDLNRESLKSECVTGKVAYTGKIQTLASISRIKDNRKLMTSLGLEVGGEISLEVLNAHGASDFYLETLSNNYRDTFVYNLSIKGLTAKLTNLEVSDKVKALPPEKRRMMCGNHFISSVDLGAELFVNVSFNFSDSQLKSHFNSEVDVDIVDLFNGYGKGQANFEQYKNKISVKIEAFQLGGNNTNIASVLSNSEGKSFIQCDIANLEPCQHILENILEFASNDFINDIKHLRYDPTNGQGAGIVNYNFMSYEDAGLDSITETTPELILQNIKERRQEMLEDYLTESQDYKIVKNILQTRLRSEEKEQFLLLKTIIESNLKKLVKATEICFEDYKNCDSAYSNINLVPYEKNLLNRSFGLWDYCSSMSKSEDQEIFFKALKKSLKISGPNFCDDLEKKIQTVDAIYLPNANLSNVELLKHAKNVRKLVLRGNNIANIEFLKNLNKLTYLDLSKNEITSIPEDLSMPNLKYLNLSKNKLNFSDNIIIALKQSPLNFLSIVLNDVDDLDVLSSLEKPGLVLGQNYFVHLDDFCEKLRLFALNHNLISQERYQSFKVLGDFPDFPNWEHPTWGQVISSSSCHAPSQEDLLLREIDNKAFNF